MYVADEDVDLWRKPKLQVNRRCVLYGGKYPKLWDVFVLIVLVNIIRLKGQQIYANDYETEFLATHWLLQIVVLFFYENYLVIEYKFLIICM